MIYMFISAVIALIIIFCYYQNNKIDITEYRIESDKIKSSLTIAQLSDMHSKPFKKVVEKLKAIRPDVIMITGDFINDHGKNKEKMFEIGKELLSLSPVYYITGNHERRLDDFDVLMKELSDLGFTVLLNDISEEIIKPYFDKLEKSNGFKFVLSHFPENFENVKENNYSQYNFDLQLSGHAHGGQFILPFIGPVFSPGQGLFPKYARGSFGEKPRLIISRGLGNSEFPLRLFNHPEINIIKLTKPQE